MRQLDSLTDYKLAHPLLHVASRRVAGG